jgi:hypothetical protein
MIDVVRTVVGDTLDRLILSDTLGRNSPTPPKHRHPLAEIVETVRESARSLETLSPTIDARSVVEMHSLVSILQRWSDHPLWPQIGAALANEYSHTVITLAAASILQDVGNAVMLFEAKAGRGADLMLVAGARQRAAVEVKAPKVLRWPASPLTREQSAEVVSKAIKKAGTGERGQLSSRESGLLVIGGFHLGLPDLDTLERAASDYLREAARRKRHPQLLGIGIVTVGVNTEAGFNAVGVVEQKLFGVVQVRVAKNSGYKGEMDLSTEARAQ